MPGQVKPAGGLRVENSKIKGGGLIFCLLAGQGSF
jgi:hypothetical protein